MKLGKGVYDVAEAARLADVAPRLARRWFAPASRSNAVGRDYESVDGHLAMSFLELIELRVVGWLRAQGVALGDIRQLHVVLGKRWGTTHPFAHRRLLTERRAIIDGSENGRVGRPPALARPDAMASLRRRLRGIAYDADSNLARRWCIAPGVVIDPQLRFGKPIVAHGGISTLILYRAYVANREDVAFVARLFETTPRAVRAAVQFERDWADAA